MKRIRMNLLPRKMKRLALVLGLLLTAISLQAQSQDLSQVEEAFQGQWTCLTYSTDGGQTQIPVGKYFGEIYGTKAMVADKGENDFINIVATDYNGVHYNVVSNRQNNPTWYEGLRESILSP